MKKRILTGTLLFVTAVMLTAQNGDPRTLLQEKYLDQIIGETSGETGMRHIIDMAAYNHNRPASEYGEGTFWEAEYVYGKLKEYGLEGAAIERFPGRQVWDGIRGELWEVKPGLSKLADYDDITTMLASGSVNSDVTAPLIWIGEGSEADLQGLNLDGKVVLTSAAISRVHDMVVNKGALGVVSFVSSRPLIDPLQMPSGGFRSRGEATFGFYMPPREGHILRDRLRGGEEITIHAQVEAQMMDYDLQVPTCVIPGTDANADELIFSAHLFEGYIKQGANDNVSGGAAILEVARTLKTLIDEGRIPAPKRSIRFIWVPEYSGTGPWVIEHRDLMKKTLCNINLDMVGLWLKNSDSFLTLQRTTYGHPHYINDVVGHYMKYVGLTNREGLAVSGRGGFLKRIVAPSGTADPFYYKIDDHYGASDHEVFNDPGVQVPGVMLITWPDHYYHTSEDRANKCDATQMKRVQVISAASAYLIASADENMADDIASEIFGNAGERIGNQYKRAVNALTMANAGDFAEAYINGRQFIEAAIVNEKNTLTSVLELNADQNHLKELTEGIQAMGASYLQGLESLMKNKAAALKVKPVALKLTADEKKLQGITPRQTDKMTENGYRSFGSILNALPSAVKEKYSASRMDVSELARLVDGQTNGMDILKQLNAQKSYYGNASAIAVYNQLMLMKEAGLVSF